jgi:hypothetical protein
MVTITCNCCQKPIQNPALERNFFSVLGRDICRSCFDRVKAKAESLAVQKGSYSFGAYKTGLATAVRSMCK